MNFHQVSKISLSKKNVDAIVFWTKNPRPMMDRLSLLDGYHYYFQFTVTPYGKDLEPYVPDKSEVIKTFLDLSEMLSPEQTVWRYDPILFSEKYNYEYHIEKFESLAEIFSGSTEKCVISFIDMYKNTIRNLGVMKIREAEISEKNELALEFRKISSKNNISLQACCCEDLSRIPHASCIDKSLIEKLCGRTINAGRDKSQRKLCGCVQSADIGAYNTCMHGCLYCYANYNSGVISKNISNHSPMSDLITGRLSDDDKIHERADKTVRYGRLF